VRQVQLAAPGIPGPKTPLTAKSTTQRWIHPCELLLRARLVPDRAGADTQVVAHIPLSQLRQLPGAGDLEDAWFRARLGEDGYLTGKDAEPAACDAQAVPVVTGAMDPAVIDKMIDLAKTAAQAETGAPGPVSASASPTADSDAGTGRPDGTTEARGPDGRQVIYSHAPPARNAA
jgi:hypothetical protein